MCFSYLEVAPSALVGEVIKEIDDTGDGILLTARSGKKFWIKHEQDCCEQVSEVHREGEFSSLIGKPLLVVKKDKAQDNKSFAGVSNPEYPESTTFIFKTADDVVISRWFGDSNGYYSTDVTLSELVKRP